MTITNFTCFENKHKKNEKQPDYKLSTKIDNEFVEIGAGWIKEKEGEDGVTNSYISFKLTEPYEARNGYHIEVDLAPKQPVKPEVPQRTGSAKPEVTVDYPDEEIDPGSIPF